MKRKKAKQGVSVITDEEALATIREYEKKNKDREYWGMKPEIDLGAELLIAMVEEGMINET